MTQMGRLACGVRCDQCKNSISVLVLKYSRSDFSEGEAGAGFKVLLDRSGFCFVGEGVVGDYLPGAVGCGVGGLSGVVGGESLRHV